MTYQHEVADKELIFRFSEPIQLSNHKGIIDSSKGWLEDLIISHDSLFLKLTPATRFQLKTEANSIVIDLRRPKKTTAASDSASIRLQLLKARLWFRQGKVDDALALLDIIIQENPDHTSAILTKADFQSQLRNRKTAFKLGEQAVVASPRDVAVAKTRDRLQLPFRPFLVLESTLKDTCACLLERFNRIQLEGRINQSWLFGIKWATHEVLENKRSYPAPLLDEHYQMELYAGYECETGSLLRFSTFINEVAAPGVTGSYRFPDDRYELTLGLDINRPNWEFFYNQVEPDSKDRIRANWHVYLYDHLRLNFFQALNRYRIENLEINPLSLTLRGGFVYIFPQFIIPRRWMGDHSYLTFSYTLDTEHPLDVGESELLDETRFRAITHTARLDGGKQVWNWEFSGYIGHAYSVFTGSGNIYGGRISYSPHERLIFYLFTDRYVNDDGCQPVRLYTMGLKWIF